MEQNGSGLEEFLAELRPTLPAQSRTAQAIDDGYIDFAEQLNSFMESCLRRGM